MLRAPCNVRFQHLRDDAVHVVDLSTRFLSKHIRNDVGQMAT